MKILIVTPYYAPAWGYGGPPRVLSIFARGLVKAGHSVSVITTDALSRQRNPVMVETMEKVKVYRFRTISNRLAYKQKIFYVPNLLSKAKKIVSNADVVLFSDVRSILNWQLFRFVLKTGIRYGVFAFGQIPYSKDWKAQIKRWFDLLWVNQFIGSASWCFAQTEHERDMYVRHFHIPRNKTRLVLLPVQLPDKVSITSVRNAYFSEFGIKPQDRLILFVGRFHYLKGVDILLKIVAPLIRKSGSLKLVLIGRDDGEEQRLRSMVPNDLDESILFPGALYGTSLAPWYRRASCFAFTPRYPEETSTAALEALSWGCPVVTTHQSEIPFLNVYNAGIEANGVPAIRKAIHMLLKTTKNMKKNATRLIRDKYRSDIVARELLTHIGHER